MGLSKFTLKIKALGSDYGSGNGITKGGPTPGGPTPGNPDEHFGPEGENLHIIAKNTQNLDEYEAKVFFDPNYIPKLQKWVNQEKYEIEQDHKTMLVLSIGVSTFYLKKNNKTDLELIKSEINDLKKKGDEALKQIKLFQYYFLNFWKEKYRDLFKAKEYICGPCIDSSQNLYNLTDGIGYVEENDQMYQKTFYIGFKQPLSHTSMNGKGRGYKYLDNLNGKDKKISVFATGKGLDCQMIDVESEFSHKMMIEGHDTPYYMHNVSIPVMTETSYEVLTPKIFF